MDIDEFLNFVEDTFVMEYFVYPTDMKEAIIGYVERFSKIA